MNLTYGSETPGTPAVPVYQLQSHNVKELLDNALRVLPLSHPYYNTQQQAKAEINALWELRKRMPVDLLISESFRLIDKYFFFSNIGPHIQLVIHHGSFPWDFYRHSERKIFICTREEPNLPRGPEDMVASVVHEAVHAYLILFATPASLKAEDLGQNPHALPFRVLYQTLTNMICRWVPDPTGFTVICDLDGDEIEAESHHLSSYPGTDIAG
ncbi:hypothetical protein PG994_005152 [Apiospora phragmitis]|uniref:SprT-like domain-containing protein n=1 Tax=Apiospora phragmitis TaxID=2905665 RepID=A0ABR1VWN0_9PEZI